MPRNTDLFTPEEHIILSSWLGVAPAEDIGPKQSVDKALVRLGFSKAGVYGGEPAAVGAIVLDRVQEHVPYCVTSMITAEGSWEVVSSQDLRDRHPRKLQLFPRHLFTINWTDGSSEENLPCSYYLTWVPIYEVYVVTTSYDTPEALGYMDVALRHFGATDDVVGEAGKAIACHWIGLHSWGQRQWKEFWSAGLIDAEGAESLAREAWFPEFWDLMASLAM